MDNYSGNLLFLQLIQIGGLSANNAFLLVSGYFMIVSGVNYKRVLNLTAELFFYAWSVAVILFGFRVIPLSAKEIVKAAFPVWFGYNWYVCCYLIFCCFAPFLNEYLRSISQKTYLKLLLISLFIWSFAYTFRAETYMGADFSVDHFMIVYMLGGYIRLYGVKVRGIRNWRKVFVVLFLLLIGSVLFLSLGGYALKSDALFQRATYFSTGANILDVLMMTSLFLAVLDGPSFSSAAVNRIAQSVAGIFLLHNNPLLKTVIWEKISPNVHFFDSPWLPVHAIVKVTVVFLVCLAIDQLRIALVEPLFMAWLNRNWDKLKKYAHEKGASVWNAFH